MDKSTSVFLVCIVSFFLVFFCVSCDTDTSVEQKEDTETKSEEKDTEPRDTVPHRLLNAVPGSEIVNILFVDENKKSILDPEGKNWSKEDIKIFYHVDGKNYPKETDYDQYAPILDHPSPFVSKGEGNHTFPEEPWLMVHPSGRLDADKEFKTVLISFPDQTTDTIIFLFWEGTHYLKNVWHNGVLKIDNVFDEDDLYNSENNILVTFSDGTVGYPNDVWWEAEK